jgi:putative tricarboxylic transport membrane protein
MQRIKNMNDVLAGAFMILMGAVGLWLSWRLHTGSAGAMGPGYIPKMLAFILMALGSVTIFYAFVHAGEAFEPWYPRPLVFVLASVAFFGLTVRSLGLVASIIGMVLIGCLANKDTKPYEAVLLGAGMAIFSVLVFVKGLGLSIEVWPTMSTVRSWTL